MYTCKLESITTVCGEMGCLAMMAETSCTCLDVKTSGIPIQILKNT